LHLGTFADAYRVTAGLPGLRINGSIRLFQQDLFQEPIADIVFC